MAGPRTTPSAASGLVCASKPASNVCLPQVGNSAFTANRATFLPQPRVGIAWSPFDRKTVIRAGFGMYNDLQDALGYRADQNAPSNPTYTIGATSLTNIFVGGNPIQPSAPPPTSPLALLLPGGVQPDLSTPTLISYSLTIERELTPNTSLSVGYVGNHGYHEIIGLDANAPVPVVCPAAPCPARFPRRSTRGPVCPCMAPWPGNLCPRARYFNPTSTKPNTSLANTWTWFSEGTSYYNALQVDLNHRFSEGLSIRGVYTWSKTLDDGDSLNATAANNAVALLSDPYNPRVDWGLATFDVRNAAGINASYELPVGHGKHFLGRSERLRKRRHQRLDSKLHRHRAVGIPVYAAAQLQPGEQRRLSQSGAAVPQPGVYRTGGSGESESVVQSQRVHCAAEQ